MHVGHARSTWSVRLQAIAGAQHARRPDAYTLRAQQAAAQTPPPFKKQSPGSALSGPGVTAEALEVIRGQCSILVNFDDARTRLLQAWLLTWRHVLQHTSKLRTQARLTRRSLRVPFAQTCAGIGGTRGKALVGTCASVGTGGAQSHAATPEIGLSFMGRRMAPAAQCATAARPPSPGTVELRIVSVFEVAGCAQGLRLVVDGCLRRCACRPRSLLT